MYLDGGWKANYLIHRYHRWGRKWVCSGLSLGVHPEFSSYLHPWYVAEISCQRSRLYMIAWLSSQHIYIYVVYIYIYAVYIYIYIHSWSNIMVCCSNMFNTLFLGGSLFFFFRFVSRLLVRSKLVMMLMIMHDHHHDMPTFVASAHTFDFFLHICTGGSLSFWCRGKFSDAFGGGELHQEQLDDVMGQTV